MLIFDSFPTRERAEAFVAAVRSQGRIANVYDSQDESNAADPFPFILRPPIVLVERLSGYVGEREIEAMVRGYGGDFAGT